MPIIKFLKQKPSQLATTSRLDLLRKIRVQDMYKGSGTRALVKNKINRIIPTIHLFAYI